MRTTASWWWRRQKVRLWIHFLPFRVACAFLRHRWDEPGPVIIDGPIDLLPRERMWHMAALHQQCERCARILSLPFTEEDAARYIEAEIQSDEEEE